MRSGCRCTIICQLLQRKCWGLCLAVLFTHRKDEYTNKGLDDEADINAEVMGPMALVPLGADDNEPGASACGRSEDS